MAGAGSVVLASGPAEAANLDGLATWCSGWPAQPDINASTTGTATVTATPRAVLGSVSPSPGWLHVFFIHANSLAAFNGGFKLSAGVGGYMQEGHVISLLRPGFASLVIDRSGRARIGVWGSGLPAPGEAVYSVRQDLRPLVLNGRPTAASADWALWGATLGGGAYVARSAIGQDAGGDLVYAASMSAVPADLAAALARHGARIAMELDINPEWVQLDAASKPGGVLSAEIPGQYRPSDQYLAGWTRDFFTVLASPGSPAGTQPPSAHLRP